MFAFRSAKARHFHERKATSIALPLLTGGENRSPFSDGCSPGGDVKLVDGRDQHRGGGETVGGGRHQEHAQGVIEEETRNRIECRKGQRNEASPMAVDGFLAPRAT